MFLKLSNMVINIFLTEIFFINWFLNKIKIFKIKVLNIVNVNLVIRIKIDT